MIMRPVMSELTMDVVDNGAGRYDMSIDGTPVGFVEYHLADSHMILSYIEIDPAYGGRGLGGRLTAWVLDDCRSRGLRVTPECPFIVRFMREHPEYADLRAS